MLWMCLLTGSFCSQPPQQEAELGAEAGGQQQGGGGGGLRHSFVLPSRADFLVSLFTFHRHNPGVQKEAVTCMFLSALLILTGWLELGFN